jgi:hypothetical protein
MVDKNPKQQFLTSLLAQDQSLSSPEYQEYRAMLEQKLATAERKAKNRWRMTVGMWAATATLFIAGLLLATQLFPVAVHPVGAMLMGLGSVFFYLSLLRLFMYLAFERGAPEKVRNESRDAVLMELSRKVDAIAQRLEVGGGPEKTAI